MARTRQVRTGDPGPGLNKTSSGVNNKTTAGNAPRVASELFYDPQQRCLLTPPKCPAKRVPLTRMMEVSPALLVHGLVHLLRIFRYERAPPGVLASSSREGGDRWAQVRVLLAMQSSTNKSIPGSGENK